MFAQPRPHTLGVWINKCFMVFSPRSLSLLCCVWKEKAQDRWLKINCDKTSRTTSMNQYLMDNYNDIYLLSFHSLFRSRSRASDYCVGYLLHSFGGNASSKEPRCTANSHHHRFQGIRFQLPDTLSRWCKYELKIKFMAQAHGKVVMRAFGENLDVSNWN